jgi:acyl-CoA synthetase (AMP-forming)/AMP-acid ligase II
MPSRNLGRCFEASYAPDKVAIVDLREWEHPRETTYAQFDAECDAVARGLVRRGFGRGDRIGILSLNRRELLTAYFGTMRAGMVTVPISFKLAPETVAHVVADAALKAIFHDSDRAALCPTGPAAISFDDPQGYEALLDPGPFETVEPGAREVAMILYTSGSTGRPKGVLLSHDSQRWALERGGELYGESAAHRYIVAAPMFHMNATISVKSGLASGGSIVLLPTFRALDYARAIDKFKVTWLTSVPTMLAMVAKEGERLGGLDFSSVTDITMGSAPLTQALFEKVQAMFPAAHISNGYGTTEGGPSPFGPHPDGLPQPPTSVGYPAAGTEAELREGASADEGVLYMRSPMLMEGYNNLPEKTAEVMFDGWYRSGDIMRRDRDGFFYFVGRADDMFVVGGENVWPGEVEKLIERMPEIHQAAVVPVPDEIKGMLPFAFVVRRPAATVSAADIKAFTIANGPAFAHPRFIHFLDEIPLAGTNKPDKRKLTGLAREFIKGADIRTQG